MTWMVSVTWGSPAPQPGFTSTSSAAIIGFAAAVPSTGGTDVNPVHVYSALELTSTYGLTTADIAYNAAVDFFNAGGTDLWLYVLVDGDNSATVTDTEFTGIKNSSNKVFNCAYSPIVSLSNLEYSTDGGDNWTALVVTTDYTLNTTADGSYDGGITFVTITPDETYTIRGDVATSGVGKAVNALQAPGIVINGLAFAYDQTKAATSGAYDDDFRYTQTLTYSNKSWLGDVIEGASAAATLFSAGKQAMFVAQLPDGVGPNTLITAALAYDTDYDAGTYTYNQLLTIIGTNAHFMPIVARQSTDGAVLCANILGALMSDEPRRPFKYYSVEGLSQTSFPTIGEITQWDTAQINTIGQEYFSDGTQFTVVTGNHTFGTGWEGKINYVRCKDIVTRKLVDNLKAALLTREIKFSSRGAQHVYDIIDAVMDWALSNNYIDGKGAITIPIKTYLDNESKLTKGQQTFLDNERSAGVFSNIEVSYEWKGDVDTIIISALVND